MKSILSIRLDWKTPPASLEKAAEAFTKEVMEEIAQGPPPRHLVAFSVGPARAMRWELADAPSPPDDLIRALAEHEQAHVVGLVHPAPVPPHVQADRAWIISTEDAARRLEVMMALRGDTPTGGAEHFQMLQAATRAMPARWVGVAPTEISLVELGEAFVYGPAGEG